MALKKVDAVIFDLDNTLYNEEIFYYQYFKIFCKKFNYPFKKFLLMFNISQEIFKVDILKSALLKIKKNNINNHDKSYKLLINFKCEIKFYNGVLQTLNYLRKNKVNIGILTNGSVKIQKKKIKNLKLKTKVDKIVYAGNFKKQKPFKDSFVKILKSLKVKADNTVFIGDNYKTDIIGAKKLNMFTIYYSKKKKAQSNKESDLVANNFDDVTKILKLLLSQNLKKSKLQQ
jgi:putative hydrolase of the HAD superfamily